MDFIERLFGVSPDGGDGTTELMYIIAFILIAVALVIRSFAAHKPQNRPRNE